VRPHRIKRSFNCRCGASIAVSGPVATVEDLLGQFRERHHGERCGETTAMIASQARRRAEHLGATRQA